MLITFAGFPPPSAFAMAPAARSAAAISVSSTTCTYRLVTVPREWPIIAAIVGSLQPTVSGRIAIRQIIASVDEVIFRFVRAEVLEELADRQAEPLSPR